MDNIDAQVEDLNGAISNDVTEAATAEVPVDVKPEPKTLEEAVAAAAAKHGFKSDATPVEAAPAAPAAAEANKAVDPITGRTIEPIKAPASLTPLLREKWSSVDPAMQQYWVDRENEISRKLNETAEQRKLATELATVMGPYEPMLRAAGQTSLEHIKDFMNLSYVLNTQSPQHRAHAIHQLIMRFQPDFNTLSQLAVGAQVQPPQSAPSIDKEVERVISQREEQRLVSDAQRTLAEFAADPKNEFFADVKDTMQKAIDAGLVDGKDLTDILSNAYKFACQNHPEVSKVMAQRASMAAPAAVAPSKPPVRSIKPSPGSGKASSTPKRAMTLDEAVAEAAKVHGFLN